MHAAELQALKRDVANGGLERMQPHERAQAVDRVITAALHAMDRAAAAEGRTRPVKDVE